MDSRELREQFRTRPLWFVDDILGCNLWPVQQKIVTKVAKFDHVCVPSCHASGKDYTSARVVLWFLLSHRPSIVITTGPTDRQVREILWREIAVAHRSSRYNLGGRLLKQKLELGADWFALGFTSADTDATAGQGFHSHHILTIIDESAGVTRDTRDAIQGNLSGGYTTKLLEIGNPTDPTSPFASECARSGTHTYGIDAFNTPNFIEFGIKPKDIDSGDWIKKVDGRPLPAPYLISPAWVHTQVDRLGWDDPFVVARVRGRFPGAGPDSILTQQWIDDAAEATYRPHKNDPIVLVCDVARFGDDETVIGYRKGYRYRTLERGRGNDTMDTAGRILNYHRKMKAAQIRVDDDGVGGGVTDRLREELEKTGEADIVYPMRGGAAPMDENPIDGPRFLNARAEWHWHMKMEFKGGRVDIDDNDHELKAQLAQLKIKRWDGSGRIVIEAKEDFKKRVGRSPDDSDTLLYALAPVDLYPAIQVF